MQIRLATSILAGMAATAIAAPALAAPVTLKVTTCLARNHDFTQAFLETFVKPLNAKKASVKLLYLGGPEVTPFKEQGSSLKRGLVDMILCPAAYYGGLFGEARLPGAVPFRFPRMRAAVCPCIRRRRRTGTIRRV
jgi:hypothetical protein